MRPSERSPVRLSEHLLRFRRFEPTENPLVSLWGTLREGAEAEEFLDRLRPRDLWMSFGGEGALSETIEAWVLGEVDSGEEGLPPPGLERVFWLFGHVLPKNLLEAGYWRALSLHPKVPDVWRRRALRLALRNFGAERSRLGSQERGQFYRLRKKYARGIPSGERRKEKGEGRGVEGVAFLQSPFGRFLASLRTSLGLTQSEVASRMGVSQERVSLLERKHLGMRLSTVRRYARALGVNLKTLPHERGEDGKPLSALVEKSGGRLVLRFETPQGEVVGEYLVLPTGFSSAVPSESIGLA